MYLFLEKLREMNQRKRSEIEISKSYIIGAQIN